MSFTGISFASCVRSFGYDLHFWEEDSMPRVLREGSISFGLVNVPFRLYTKRSRHTKKRSSAMPGSMRPIIN